MTIWFGAARKRYEAVALGDRELTDLDGFRCGDFGARPAPPSFMPEMTTRIDPITGHELRIGRHRQDEVIIELGYVLVGRGGPEMRLLEEMRLEQPQLDGELRELLWLTHEASRVFFDRADKVAEDLLRRVGLLRGPLEELKDTA